MKQPLPSREAGLPERIVSRIRRNFPLALFDLSVVLVSYMTTLILRFDGNVPPPYWRNFFRFVAIAGLVHLLCNYHFGLYGQIWRYASVHEARRVIASGAAAGATIAAIDLALERSITPVPLSVVVTGSVLSLAGFGAIRFQSRLFAVRRMSLMVHRRRVLLVGAGEGGAIVVRDILHDPSTGLQPVGFVDDDRRKVGLALHGVPVLGGRAAIPSLVDALRVDQVLLTIPSATSQLVQDVAALCEEADVTLRVLPSSRETINGHVTARDVRDLKIEDLLGRQQLGIDVEAVTELIHGRRVLITGAGGSIGSEIARQVVALRPQRLVLLDHDETHLHDVHTDLDGAVDAELVLADIRERDRIFDVFWRHRPEIVFHGAAHKHVDLLEVNGREAVLTNVYGTANVADAALSASVRQFVMISTDKAVKPASVMGASKWLAEQIVRSLDYEDVGCRFCAVRFGNVLGSRGSVVPTFFRQIAHGGPVTVTHPDMCRYFMSLGEAVQLVLQAAALCEGGEVFTLDMGEPIKILDLARKSIRLSGHVPNRDVKIEIVGTRPGEKLEEDIIDPNEEPIASNHPALLISRPDTPDRGALRRAMRRLEILAEQNRSDEIRDLIKELAQSSLRPVGDEVML